MIKQICVGRCCKGLEEFELNQYSSEARKRKVQYSSTHIIQVSHDAVLKCYDCTTVSTILNVNSTMKYYDDDTMQHLQWY